MAEFEFYTTWEDSLHFLRVLPELKKFVFFVEMWYTEPVPLQFTSLSPQIASVVRKQVRLFLQSDDYSRFPIRFGKPTSIGTRMIRPTESGPLLDLELPSEHFVEGALSVACGCVRYLPTYENPDTGELYKPPEALKQAYADVRRLLQANMVKRYFRSRSITERGFRPTVELCWLGHHAAELLEAGQAGILIGPEWNWKKGSDLKKSRTELLPLTDEDA